MDLLQGQAAKIDKKQNKNIQAQKQQTFFLCHNHLASKES